VLLAAPARFAAHRAFIMADSFSRPAGVNSRFFFAGGAAGRAGRAAF
jgi:hypothetical protein